MSELESAGDDGHRPNRPLPVRSAYSRVQASEDATAPRKTAKAETPSIAEVRAWAWEQGYGVGDRGPLPADVIEAWNRRHRSRQHTQLRCSSEVAPPRPRCGPSAVTPP